MRRGLVNSAGRIAVRRPRARAMNRQQQQQQRILAAAAGSRYRGGAGSMRNYQQEAKHGSNLSGEEPATLHLLEEGDRQQLLGSGRETRRRLESLYGLSSYVTQAVLKAANAQTERRLRLLAGVIAALALLIYILRDRIKAHVSEEAAELTSRAMQQQSVRTSAELVGKSLAHEILHDPTVAEAGATLAARVVRMSETKDAAKDLVIWLAGTDDTRLVVGQLLKQVVMDLAKDQDIILHISSLLSNALKAPEARAAVIDVACDLLDNDNTNLAVRDLVLRLLDRDDARAALADAFGDAVHQALDDPELRAHATEFARGALADRRIQKSAGDALWNAYKYSIGLGPRRANTPNQESHSNTTSSTTRRRRSEENQASSSDHADQEAEQTTTDAAITVISNASVEALTTHGSQAPLETPPSKTPEKTSEKQ